MKGFNGLRLWFKGLRREGLRVLDERVLKLRQYYLRVKTQVFKGLRQRV